jgi:hypothetical protein
MASPTATADGQQEVWTQTSRPGAPIGVPSTQVPLLSVPHGPFGTVQTGGIVAAGFVVQNLCVPEEANLQVSPAEHPLGTMPGAPPTAPGSPDELAEPATGPDAGALANAPLPAPLIAAPVPATPEGFEVGPPCPAPSVSGAQPVHGASTPHIVRP